MTDILFKVTHKVGPNTRVRTILALVFLCPFLPLGVGNFLGMTGMF